MYQPVHFREERPEVLHGLIAKRPLGLLISSGPQGLLANPVPFRLEAGGALLTCHLARANSQWKDLAQAPECLVVFSGEDTYVTPGWYASKAEHGKVVPTWNYITVQARGRARVIEDAEWLRGQVAALTDAHEATRPKPWAASDAPEDFMAQQLKAIVGVEITITTLEGKWKMSQNRNAADRAGVVQGLSADGEAELSEIVAQAAKG